VMDRRINILCRHHPRRRVIQYSAASVVSLDRRGVLDARPEPVVGRRFAPTRWRA
jgi:hypothetical protein